MRVGWRKAWLVNSALFRCHSNKILKMSMNPSIELIIPVANNAIYFICVDHLGFLSVSDSKCGTLVWSLQLMGYQSFIIWKKIFCHFFRAPFYLEGKKFFCYDFGGYSTDALIYSLKLSVLICGKNIKFKQENLAIITPRSILLKIWLVIASQLRNKTEIIWK